ncbi:hypothetical protein AWW68_18640 [Roseivirga spongicola]|uniref:DUF4924 domain-containing protein n=1 Tax=Roseivirga spongicola TaxID=333140 RepID=A0A150WXM0_9BACT|nr:MULTISPECIES: DUF4924 family protein [Roseivirga]KYG71227.1 hypothetical protein AWW68_18640 [Roseivirga spongicola]MBO6660647.1 DUF4924 family protein [Roseivirga sp.]MBO6762393.1 DUF4924 family protein [Roseivirga sp.]MBO6910370.1 DUF4924 family protein [Roseivirga sp.]
MLLADKKKQENISEYIIYMYQTELLIRNFDFDIEKIKIHVFGNIPDEKMSEEKREDELNWYQEVIGQMKSEGLEQEGHLSYVQGEVQKLSDLSMKLLVENEDYQTIFNAARPALRESIQASEGLVNNPVQACLNGVFGLLLARMNGKQVPDETMEQIEHFGNVLSMLSHSYRELEN